MKHFALALFAVVGIATTAQAQINALGVAVAIDGDHILVGQPAPQGEAGVIYMFARADDSGEWAEAGQLQASDAEVGDFFGYSFVVDGNQLYVGAPSQEAGQGAVYVFERADAASPWTETAKLEAGEEDDIGASLALGDGFLATGSMTGGSEIAVFTHTGDGWGGPEALAAAEPQDGSQFGASLGANGNSLYVGAPGLSDGAGGVRVFTEEDGSWVEQYTIASPVAGSAFGGGGIQVSDEGQALIGAPGLIPNVQPTSMPPAGRLIWGQIEDGQLTVHQIVQEATQVPDFLGYGFHRSGNSLILGAGIANQGQGAVYTYSLDPVSNQWVDTDEIGAGGNEQLFGMVLAVQENLAVVSAPASNFGAGSVSVHTIDPETGAWEREQSLSTEGGSIELVASGSVDCEEGEAWQFTCSNVDLLAFVPIGDLGGGESTIANDIWGWTNSETGREYALVGRNDGMAFVDISDPGNPVFLGDLPLTEGARPAVWRDMKVYNNHVFIVADNAGEHGMQVFDLMQLTGEFERPATFTESAVYDGIASAHNVVINEDTGFAYIVGSSGGGETCGGGLHMVNIQDPANPEFAGCFADASTGRAGTGYSHDAQCVIYNGPDTDYTGQEICFNSNETALSISDVTDKENPVALSTGSYPNVAYAHQGWLTDDHGYFYMNDELDEIQGEIVGTRTMIWDVTDLDDPQLVKEHFSENLASDHNLYIQGNLMYQSNYQSGLRILDISDVANPVEVGFFDTVPIGTDAPGFGGSWSNYPYFPSGSIIVTSMNEGLFVVRKRAVDT